MTGGSWTEHYRGADVVVLGGTGFIGRWTARLLAACGARVHVTVRERASWIRVAGEYAIDAEAHEVDAADPDALSARLREIRPAVTFNLIGYGVDRTETNEECARSINTGLPADLVSILADLPGAPALAPRLIHVGSAAEYGAVGGDLSEDTSARPVGLYGKTKWAGTVAVERMARERELPAVTARIFTVYGPGEHDGRLLPSLIRAAGRPGVLPLTAGLQRRDFTYVEDVVEGLLRLGAAPMGHGDIVNLCTGVLTSVRSFVDEAARVLPIPGDRLGFGLMPEREAEMDHDPVSVARCRDRLGWVPSTPVAEGIRRTADFLAG